MVGPVHNNMAYYTFDRQLLDHESRFKVCLTSGRRNMWRFGEAQSYRGRMRGEYSL